MGGEGRVNRVLHLNLLLNLAWGTTGPACVGLRRRRRPVASKPMGTGGGGDLDDPCAAQSSPQTVRRP